jgi:hypothetical protein
MDRQKGGVSHRNMGQESFPEEKHTTIDEVNKIETKRGK